MQKYWWAEAWAGARPRFAIESRYLPAVGGSLPRKRKPTWDFPPEIRAILSRSPNLTLCPRFRRASAEKVVAHIKRDKCERCLAVYRQLEEESDLICFLRRSRN